MEERAGEWRAVTVLAQRLREGAKRSELIALLPAAELDRPALAELEGSGGIALAVGSALPAGVAAGAVAEVSAFDSAGIAAALRAALAREGAAVVFCRGECALTAPAGGKKYRVAGDYCRRCGACTRLGCPAIKNTRPPAIDGALCAGCGVCAQLCPCGAIREA